MRRANLREASLWGAGLGVACLTDTDLRASDTNVRSH